MAAVAAEPFGENKSYNPPKSCPIWKPYENVWLETLYIILKNAQGP